jgi:hypothetical protein
MTIAYRGCTIWHDAPPIPTRAWDWHWMHNDWDLDDPRHGDAASEQACRDAIDEILEDSE